MIKEIVFGFSGVCDFCDSKDVSYIFDCPDFVVSVSEGITQSSTDDWLACEECYQLLMDQKISSLCTKVIDKYEGGTMREFTVVERLKLSSYITDIIHALMSNCREVQHVDAS